MQVKMFEDCVDEIMEFGEEAAVKYADDSLCGPASQSYFHYILDSCIRQNWDRQEKMATSTEHLACLWLRPIQSHWHHHCLCSTVHIACLHHAARFLHILHKWCMILFLYTHAMSTNLAIYLNLYSFMFIACVDVVTVVHCTSSPFDFRLSMSEYKLNHVLLAACMHVILCTVQRLFYTALASVRVRSTTLPVGTCWWWGLVNRDLSGVSDWQELIKDFQMACCSLPT